MSVSIRDTIDIRLNWRRFTRRDINDPTDSTSHSLSDRYQEVNRIHFGTDNGRVRQAGN